MRSLVISIFLHACESWTLTAKLKKRTQAFEMKCYRELLNISHKDHAPGDDCISCYDCYQILFTFVRYVNVVYVIFMK